MGLKIEHIKGEVKSISQNAIILIAEKKNLFTIPELVGTDVLDGKVEWILKSQNKKDAPRKIILEWNNPFSLTIDKPTSGSYSYHLQACYMCAKEKKKKISTDSLNVSSYCPPRIKNLTPSVMGEIIPGSSLSYQFDLEGANFHTLELEIYSQSENNEKKLHTTKEKCVEGKVTFNIDNSKTRKWKPKKNEVYFEILVKLFDKNEKIYLDYE